MTPSDHHTVDGPGDGDARETGDAPATNDARETGDAPATNDARETGDAPATNDARETGTGHADDVVETDGGSGLAISADGLTKRYGEELAVDDVDLSIPEGAVYGFLGPNGAGKTTTMRLLTALTEPTAGTATVAGVPTDDRAALTERIGYLPADPPVFDELTGREQLRYVARLHELPEDAAVERIGRYLDRFDLAGDADRRIEGYSTGMKKKLGVIGAILPDPDVVLLDEPTSGLDPRAARTMRDTIAELAEEDVTVFLSTHVLPVAEELADTVGVIHDGALVAEGTPAELTARVESSEATDLETVFLDLTREDDARDRVDATS